jgi:hypothetical protein
MLTKVRIEVEEETVEKAVEALTKYEHAIQCAEAQRFEERFPAMFEGRSGEEPVRIGPCTNPHWSMPIEKRDFFNMELGREVQEEVIEFDSSVPIWKGRRVVRYTRIDTRTGIFLPIVPDAGFTLTGGLYAEGSGSSGVEA